MEKERKKTSRYVFLQAFLLAFLLFNFGIFLGYKLETSRANIIGDLYIISELGSFDAKIQTELFGLGEIDCDSLVKENLAFADRVFGESLLLAKYDNAKRISESIKLQHKRYDLLRTLIWVNSIKISKNCENSPHRVVYIYSYEDRNLDVLSKQKVFSTALGDLKTKHGDEIMLIPIAGDNEISSLNMLMNQYGIDKLPSIIINENIKVTEVEDINNLEQYLE